MGENSIARGKLTKAINELEAINGSSTVPIAKKAGLGAALRKLYDARRIIDGKPPRGSYSSVADALSGLSTRLKAVSDDRVALTQNAAKASKLLGAMTGMINLINSL